MKYLIFALLLFNSAFQAMANDCVEIFSDLSNARKIEEMNNYRSDFLEREGPDIRDLSFLDQGPEGIALKNQLLSEASRIGTYRVDMDLQAMPYVYVIDSPKLTYLTYFQSRGKRVALIVGVSLDGGQVSEDTRLLKQRFRSWEEANEYGLYFERLADVGWQATMFFEIEPDGSLRLLTNDQWDEGGFGWSGF